MASLNIVEAQVQLNECRPDCLYFDVEITNELRSAFNGLLSGFFGNRLILSTNVPQGHGKTIMKALNLGMPFKGYTLSGDLVYLPLNKETHEKEKVAKDG